jgi:hypothetical protein
MPNVVHIHWHTAKGINKAPQIQLSFNFFAKAANFGGENTVHTYVRNGGNLQQSFYCHEQRGYKYLNCGSNTDCYYKRASILFTTGMT